MAEELKSYLTTIFAYSLNNLYWTNISYEKPSKLPIFKDSYFKKFENYKIDWFNDWRIGLVTLKSSKRFNYLKINDLYYFAEVDKYLGKDDEERLIRYKLTYDIWVNDILLKDIALEGVLSKTLDLDLVYEELPNVSPITQGTNVVKYHSLTSDTLRKAQYIKPPETEEGLPVKENWFKCVISKKFKDKLEEIVKPYRTKNQIEDNQEFFIKGVEITKVKTWQYELISQLNNWFPTGLIEFNSYVIGEIEREGNKIGLYPAFKRTYLELGEEEKLYLIKKKGEVGLDLSSIEDSGLKIEFIDLSGLRDIMTLNPIELDKGDGQPIDFFGNWEQEEKDIEAFIE